MDINKLRSERATKIEELNAIVAGMEKEERSVKNTEERTNWNTLKSEIEDLEAEIKDAEFAEARKLEDVKKIMKKDQRSNEDKEIARYDLSKAIREIKKGNLTGFEAEIQKEGEAEYRRLGEDTKGGIILPAKIIRSFTQAGNSGHISTTANTPDILADRGMLSKLGVNVIEGATSNFSETYTDGFNADVYEEGVTGSESDYDEVNDFVQAKRVQGSKPFTNEYLAQSAFMPELMNDMMRALDTRVAKEVLEEILAVSGATLTGYDSTATAKVLTYKDLMKLKGAIKSPEFINGRFVAGGSLTSELKSTEKGGAGSGRFIAENGDIDGNPLVDAQGLLQVDGTKHEVIFGDFNRAKVYYFNSGIEILVNPYSMAKAGKTELVFHKMFDTTVNPFAFKTIKNAKLA